MEQDVSEERGDAGDEASTDIAPGDTESGPPADGHTCWYAVDR
ncbi:hypothetical protein ACFQER_06555 [Halomicroarcula sp. GCM10025894]